MPLLLASFLKPEKYMILKKCNFAWQTFTVFGLLKIFTVFNTVNFTTLVSDRERKGCSTEVSSVICSAVSVSVC